MGCKPKLWSLSQRASASVPLNACAELLDVAFGPVIVDPIDLEEIVVDEVIDVDLTFHVSVGSRVTEIVGIEKLDQRFPVLDIPCHHSLLVHLAWCFDEICFFGTVMIGQELFIYPLAEVIDPP